MKRDDNRAWLLMIPTIAIMVFVGVVPLMTVFNYSFLDIFTLQQVYWVGADWYREIITSDRFIASLGRSLLFSALALSIQIPLGIYIALILPKSGSLRIAILMLVTLPLVAPWNMIPIMWLNLINPQTGLAGQALVWLGAGFDYKFNAIHTWIVILAMDTWHWLGLVVVLSYAGLSGISPAYDQAAAIDGASRFQVFRYIQLPKLTTVLSMVVLLRFVDSLMIYTEAFRINAGGPDAATMFLSLDLGEEINAFNYGPAAARSMIYVLIVLTVAWAFRVVMDRSQANPTNGRA
jgi:glycerol transport system permease protein